MVVTSTGLRSTGGSLSQGLRSVRSCSALLFGDRAARYGVMVWSGVDVPSNVFLDAQSVVAGKQMEAISESVEDFEYFVMLRRATDRANAAGRSDAAVTKAKSLVQEGAQRVLEAPGAKALRWRDKKDRTLADQVRREILQSLSQLQ